MALPTRIGRLRLPVLCFVVSRAVVKDGDVEKAVSEAIAGGASMIRLSEAEMPAGEVLDLAVKLRSITKGKALLVVDDRVDVAVAIEADGVELPETGLPTRAARAQIGKYAVVGRSVYTAERALQATREGADYVTVGPIYKGASKSDKPAGVGLLNDISKDSDLPMLAAGGITADKVGEVIKAGAAGVAVMSAIASADDPKAAAEAFAQALKDAWAGRPEEVAATA
jgi:thiamine-phosphate pyrophosphorylase